MSPERTADLLLRLYPRRWRARYGQELEALILEAGDGRVPWRLRIDVMLAAGRERLRDAGLAGDPPPTEQMRGGSLLVLCAWTLFVVAGVSVQKLSEHWQSATPSGSRGLPTGGFDALVVAATIGSALVLVGIIAALPSLLRFLRAGGWRQLQTHVLVAGGLTLAAAPVTAGVVGWAHQLTQAQRNGHDLAYAAALGVDLLLLAACLAAWTAAAVATARRLDLSAAVLELEALLAAGVAVTMAVMTAATAVWWAALDRTAPWFLAGRPAGSPTPLLAPQLAAAAILMLVATLLAAAGVWRALHGRSATSPARRG